MREENGNSTKNARIKIDYSKIKPSVTFTYPSKEIQNGGSMYLIIFICSFFLSLFVVCISETATSDWDLKEVIKMTKYIDYNKTNLYLWTACAYENNNYSFEELWKDVCKDKRIKLYNDGILNMFYESFWANNVFKCLLIYPFILSLLIYLPFKKRWQKIYPKYQGWVTEKKVTILKSKDIKKDNEKYYCELPIFYNIILDYNATQDFSKYLEVFEIREHNFKYFIIPKRKKRLLKTKRGKERIKKRELNDCIWYARFYFTHKPKLGKITVIYK